MAKAFTFAAGIVCYLIGFSSLIFMMGWLINWGVPRSIDGPEATVSLAMAAVNNGLLFLLFAVQHSVMARPGFKRRWTEIVGSELERSIYVLFSGVTLFAVMWFWQPMTGKVWDLSMGSGNVAAYVLYAVGWAILVGSTFALNHFDLFGLRQVFLSWRNRPYEHLSFATPGPYRWVRHPLYVGWITLVWATPVMTVGHLVFALITTGYILFAIQLEEKDLVDVHGETYRQYQQQTPMLIPGLK